MSFFKPEEMEHAQDVLERVRGDWLERPGVTAVDLGFKWSAGAMVNKLAIRVHVSQKRPIADLTPDELFPKEVEGVAIDVIEATYGLQLVEPGNTVQLEAAIEGRDQRFEEIPLGVSIGSPHVSAGTLGAKVLDNVTGDEMILSNWHILVGDPDVAPGLPTLQPGRLDGGTDQDDIAILSRWVLGPFDAAVAKINGRRPVRTTTLEGMPITAAANPQLGMRVWKSGRTTGRTKGFIDGIKMTTSLNYGRAGNKVMREVFRIIPLPGATSDAEVSLGGDSGSVWVDTASGRAVGLHFAGERGNNAPEHALANEILPILQRLAVHFPGQADEDDSTDNGSGAASGGTTSGGTTGGNTTTSQSWWARFLQFLRSLFGLS